jgi:hypothetical protein
MSRAIGSLSSWIKTPYELQRRRENTENQPKTSQLTSDDALIYHSRQRDEEKLVRGTPISPAQQKTNLSSSIPSPLRSPRNIF